MAIEGRCYCGAVRFKAEGAPLSKIACYCRECQYITGGSPNVTMAVPTEGFTITGETKQFQRSDLEFPVIREFCVTCGTQMMTRIPRRPQMVLLKAGTFDDPAAMYGAPDLAIFTKDKQPFHALPDGVPAFESGPPRPGS